MYFVPSLSCFCCSKCITGLNKCTTSSVCETQLQWPKSLPQLCMCVLSKTVYNTWIMYSWAILYSSTVIGRHMRYSFVSTILLTTTWLMTMMMTMISVQYADDQLQLLQLWKLSTDCLSDSITRSALTKSPADYSHLPAPPTHTLLRPSHSQHPRECTTTPAAACPAANRTLVMTSRRWSWLGGALFSYSTQSLVEGWRSSLASLLAWYWSIY